MTWGELFEQFTQRIKAEVRLQVLQAVSNPNITIGHSWRDCLYAVAATAVGQSLGNLTSNPSKVAAALGLQRWEVCEGMSLWDSRDEGTEEARREFRERVAEFVRQEEQKALIREISNIQTPESAPKPQSALVA